MQPESRLLDLIATLRDELRAGTAGLPVRLDSRLDRDLGFDSLARAELLLRIETEFAVRLPAELLTNAETPQDFLAALGEMGHSVAVSPAPTFDADVPAEEGQPAPEALTTLAAVLQWHAAHQPERTHLIYLDEGETPAPMTYGRLWNEARAVAAALQQRGIAPGDAVALMLPTCPEFFPCFCGILLAGAVPVPIYPPARPQEIEDHLRRHAAILANAGARLLIADARVALPARLLLGQVDGLAAVELAESLIAASGTPVAVPVHADELALLQYTSGSTGVPKGVTLTHAQLLANIHAMARAAKVGRADVFVSWLPLYHDMGLICAWLSSMTYAMPFVVMSPLAFLARPGRWLHAIQRYRGTLSGAPNFAYELCLKRIPDAELAGLDLSSWRIAFNGAEPVSAETVSRFAARFAVCGLRPEALAPVYGLAECAVGLALTPERGARIDTIRRADFALRGEAVPTDDADAMRFVPCGRPLPGYAIRVVDEAGAELPERREGRIQFRGPSATAGYFRNPEATERLIRDGWWETGDRGYLLDGEIVPSGRVKDIIIKGGRNLHPQEIEQAVGAVAGIRKGCVAAFGSPDPATGTERLVVMAELTPGKPDENAVRGAVQDAVVAVVGLPADEVVLSPRRIVLKTSSGKVRRAASRELYERGMKDIAAAPRAVWLQVARLLVSGALPQARRGLRALGDRLAGLWAAGLFCLFAGPVWLITAVSPAPTFAWRFCGIAARLWFRLSGIRLKVVGLEHLPNMTNAPCVLVANHASYIDGLALVAALPWKNWRFVAKRELREGFFSRVFLERLGCDFVERFDFRQGVADAERLHDSVAAGHAPIFFPEGTFTRVPGLASFRMGAFMVAARNGVPVVPVAIAGARDRLRDGSWLPRRGTLTVNCQPPILPDGDDWHAALRLRDAARAEILRQCGEGDLQG